MSCGPFKGKKKPIDASEFQALIVATSGGRRAMFFLLTCCFCGILRCSKASWEPGHLVGPKKAPGHAEEVHTWSLCSAVLRWAGAMLWWLLWPAWLGACWVVHGGCLTACFWILVDLGFGELGVDHFFFGLALSLLSGGGCFHAPAPSSFSSQVNKSKTHT